MATISTTLRKINHYWKSGKVAPEFLKSIVRTEFAEIKNSLSRERILAVVGPRRVGKSTLLYQTIDHLIASGVNPTYILFFSGDEPALFTNSEINIGTIIESYEMDVLKHRLEDTDHPIYVLIDEIHVVNDWQLWLKSYFDRKYKIKFIVSGSSSTHLFKGAKESLLGRIENVYVLPLGFREFTRLYTEYKKPQVKLRLFDLLPAFSVFDKPLEYAVHLNEHILEIEDEKIAVHRLLHEYLLVGGYPEYFATDSLLYWQRQLTEDIISRGLFRDVISIYSIKNPEILEKLLYFVAANNGQPHSFSTLAQTMGIDFTTLSNYLSYLSSAFMVTILENYSSNAGKIIRKNKKLYVSDSGISNALLRLDELSNDQIGHLIEQNCVEMVRGYAEANLFDIRYYRDGDVEVDIVLDKKTDTLPVGVKYRNEVGSADAKPIMNFMEQFSSKNGLVLTKDCLNVQDNVAFVPFWLLN